jgi:hypothetical protein
MSATTLFAQIGVIFLPLLLGVIATMKGSHPIAFWIARACFVIIAADLVIFPTYEAFSAGVDGAIFFPLLILVWGVVFCGLFFSLYWVKKEEGLNSARLVPGDVQTPPLRPTVMPIPPNALMVFWGSNMSWATTFPRTVIRMGATDLLTIGRSAKTGVLVIKTLRIYDDRNNIIVRVDENEFWVGDGNRKKRPDPSTLIVYDHFDVEVLRITLLNKSAVVIRGILRCPGYAPAVITDTFAFIASANLRGNYFGSRGFGNQGVDIFVS